MIEKTEWLLCPWCKNKTRNKLREDTILLNFPLFCPKCKQECIVTVKKFRIVDMIVPDARRRADKL